MVIDEKIIYVYDDFSEDSPCLIGKLYVGVIKGGETYSFEYDADWLAKNKMRVSLDPQLQPKGNAYLLEENKENQENCMIVIICWGYTTKPEWEGFVLSLIPTDYFFLMTRKPQHLHGQN